MPLHKMQTGESVAALAEVHGLFALTIWNHPENDLLRQRRQRIDALAPGDQLFIPTRTERIDRLATGQRHRFLRRGIPAKFRAQFRIAGQPCAHQPYRLDVAGRSIAGQTDADGVIEAFVPASAQHAVLRLGDDESPPIQLHFGSMEPDNTLGGARKRLANLGIDAPSGDDLSDHDWRLAIYRFQRRVGLPPTMRLDDETLQALLKCHDRIGPMTRPVP